MDERDYKALNQKINAENVIKELRSKGDDVLNEIANAMERWHLARDNDDETLKTINDILYSHGYLKWFNEDNKETDLT